MTVTGINHAVLYVRDARRTARFYEEALGFREVISEPGGAYAFMRAPGSQNHHDLAFFSIGAQAGPSPAGAGTVGLYHVAWAVSTLEELAEARDKLAALGCLVGASDHGVNKSLYCRDPDGLEFEVTWVVPAERWGAEEHAAIVRPLDIEGDIARYGARTPGNTVAATATPERR
jgi:catechol-2,3-dioxygenase